MLQEGVDPREIAKHLACSTGRLEGLKRATYTAGAAVGNIVECTAASGWDNPGVAARRQLHNPTYEVANVVSKVTIQRPRNLSFVVIQAAAEPNRLQEVKFKRSVAKPG